MCYSEELKREAGGFMVGDQWVLTGWKGMYVENAKVKEVLVPHCQQNFRWIMSPSTGFEWDKIEAEPTITYTKESRVIPIGPGKPVRYFSSFSPEYTYEFGKVMTDNHGFHLAATLDGAKGAVYQSSQTVYTKILALESAIEDNHAHVVMVLEPGKEPTEEQIQEIGRAKYEKYVGKSGTMMVPQLTAGSVTFASTSAASAWIQAIQAPAHFGTSATLTAAHMQQLYGQVTMGAAGSLYGSGQIMAPQGTPTIWGDADEIEDES